MDPNHRQTADQIHSRGEQKGLAVFPMPQRKLSEAFPQRFFTVGNEPVGGWNIAVDLRRPVVGRGSQGQQLISFPFLQTSDEGQLSGVEEGFPIGAGQAVEGHKQQSRQFPAVLCHGEAELPNQAFALAEVPPEAMEKGFEGSEHGFSGLSNATCPARSPKIGIGRNPEEKVKRGPVGRACPIRLCHEYHRTLH
jgi:hypothetical protein